MPEISLFLFASAVASGVLTGKTDRGLRLARCAEDSARYSVYPSYRWVAVALLVRRRSSCSR